MCRRHPKPMISLLVPRRRDHGHRDRVWRWLHKYWRWELRHESFEIVIGHDPATHKPFSKSVAVNNAARRARGDIFVIVDSDTYLPGRVIVHCAERIRRARHHGVRLWFVPYRHIFRLTPEATHRVLESNPKHPLRFPSPPDPHDVQDTVGSGHGHRFGAMITIMPREAFEFVGGMDERFRGWGGEDVSFLRALDTLWAKHRNTPNDVLHLWHPKLHVGEPSPHAGEQWRTRVWGEQVQARLNDWLAMQYARATGRPHDMRALVETGFPPPRLARLQTIRGWFDR